MDKAIIIRNFSRCAHVYDEYANVQKLAAIELFRLVKSSKPKNILELGCGTGNFTCLLAAKFSNTRIKAVDFSLKMLEVASQKINNKNVEFIPADCEKINLNNSFELIVSNASIQWVRDLRLALRKYKAMLAKNGKIAFSIFGPKTYQELNTVIRQVKSDFCFNADNFLSQKQVKEIFKNEFPGFILKRKVYREDFSDLTCLLKSIKYTGTAGQGSNGDFVLSLGKIKQLEGIYLKKYLKIRASYEVFFCEAVL